MGDVLVESAPNHVSIQKKAIASTIPNVESFEGLPLDGGDEYANLKKLQRQLECVIWCHQSFPRLNFPPCYCP